MDIKELASIAKELNEVTDKLVNSIKTVEQFLAEKKFGVEAIIETNLSEIYLAYKKHNNIWRIYIIYDDSPQVTPLTDCKKSLRIHMVKYIPQLINKIQVEAKLQIEETNEAIDQVEKALEELNK